MPCTATCHPPTPTTTTCYLALRFPALTPLYRPDYLLVGGICLMRDNTYAVGVAVGTVACGRPTPHTTLPRRGQFQRAFHAYGCLFSQTPLQYTVCYTPVLPDTTANTHAHTPPSHAITYHLPHGYLLCFPSFLDWVCPPHYPSGPTPYYWQGPHPTPCAGFGPFLTLPPHPGSVPTIFYPSLFIAFFTFGFHTCAL